MTSRIGIVGAILSKDLRTHTRDRFYVVISILGLGVYIAVFWLLPSAVDESVTLGLHADDLPAAVTGAVPADAGLEIVRFASGAELEAAVAEGDAVVAGLDFPDGFLAALAAGDEVSVRLLLTDAAPEELRPALSGLVRELAFALVGEPLPVTVPALDEVVVGVDRSGEQISIRERMRPLFVFFVLLVEMLALAALVASEIHQRTITAILATPARVSDVLAAKAVLGTLLAFSQALLLMVATGSFARGPELLVVTLLLGAVLATGFGLIAGSSGRDFIGIVFWAMLIMLPMAIPAVAALFPGTAAAWIRALPTHGLVQVLVGTTAYGEGWADALPNLMTLLMWCAIAFVVGVVLLRRRVARL